VEVKWSDHPYKSNSELDNCVEFVRKNPTISHLMVTSRTIADENFMYKGVQFEFEPASFYTYIIGANILRRINKFQ
jgi:uncharacterized protein